MSDEPATVITDRPGAEAAVKIRTLPWYAMIGVRVARTYIQGVLGFLVAGMVGNPNAREFSAVLLTAASLALAPAVVALLMNGAEILAKLDTSQPQLRA